MTPLVDRCGDCGHWDPAATGEDRPLEGYGTCAAISRTYWDAGAPAFLSADDPYIGVILQTKPDFGCAQFERRAD